jgi:DNA-binding MarR family transcriptional regulator
MSDDSAQRLAELAPRIMGAFHQMRAHAPRHDDMTMRQFQALIILSTRQPMQQSDLNMALGLAASTGTELVTRLIDMGCVEKSHGQGDRRQTVLRLTEAGERRMQERRTAMVKAFEMFIAPFDESDRKAFVDAFEQIWTLIQRYQRK